MAKIDDEVLERLEAEAKVADASPEELTIAVGSDVEEKESRVEELEQKVEEKTSTVEELQAEVEEKESTLEELQEEVETVSDFYSEELAEQTPTMESEEFKDRYTVTELREKYESLETSDEPAPNSADSGPAVQSPEGGDEGGEQVDELSEAEQAAATAFRDRAKKSRKSYWNDIADEIEDN